MNVVYHEESFMRSQTGGMESKELYQITKITSFEDIQQMQQLK